MGEPHEKNRQAGRSQPLVGNPLLSKICREIALALDGLNLDWPTRAVAARPRHRCLMRASVGVYLRRSLYGCVSCRCKSGRGN